MSNPQNKEELHATITARAELDRAFARLLVEDAASVMSKNMLYLLDQQDKRAANDQVMLQTTVKEAISTAVAPLMAEFREIKARVTQVEADLVESKQDRATLHAELADLRSEMLMFLERIEHEQQRLRATDG